MNMDFDVNKVFQERLALSLGLDKYTYIIEELNKTNISIDSNYQRVFNGFYIVRRNEHWRSIYYNYFESIKNITPTFADIITYLYNETGNIEPSFSSKMLATILPDKPIWDQFILQNLSLELVGKSKKERLENAIKLYENIERWYIDFMRVFAQDGGIEFGGLRWWFAQSGGPAWWDD